MANIKAKKKTIITSEIARQRNVSYRSAVKTARRKVLDAVEANDLDSAKQLLVKAESTIAKAGQKGIFKKETVARRVSRLAAHVKKAATAVK
jgi:small subunit ribosomal protein S20